MCVCGGTNIEVREINQLVATRTRLDQGAGSKSEIQVHALDLEPNPLTFGIWANALTTEPLARVMNTLLSVVSLSAFPSLSNQ